MFENETRVLMILPRELVDRARALAGRSYVRAGDAFAVARAAARIRRELLSPRKDIA